MIHRVWGIHRNMTFCSVFSCELVEEDRLSNPGVFNVSEGFTYYDLQRSHSTRVSERVCLRMTHRAGVQIKGLVL